MYRRNESFLYIFYLATAFIQIDIHLSESKVSQTLEQLGVKGFAQGADSDINTLPNSDLPITGTAS